MSNLELYDKVRIVPDTAKKKIEGGRLKGYTDINPMWRIKTLTELFGIVGVGWRYEIVEQWSEPGADGAVMAFVNINLYIKQDGKWSEAIPGTGGSALVAKETSGLYNDDEGFKKALTDAISVACKALGMGADVYWDKDSTKYTKNNDTGNDPQDKPAEQKPGCITEKQARRMFAITKGETKEEKIALIKSVLEMFGYKKSEDVLIKDYNNICEELEKGLPF